MFRWTRVRGAAWRVVMVVAGIGTAILGTSSLPSAQRGSPPLFPGQVPGEQLPVFRSRVDLIQIDVSVLDQQRQPVRGLTAKDFTLLEDGKVQEISAVVEMSASDPDAPSGSWLRTVTPDVRVNNAEDGRVLLLILDDGRTPPLPRERAGASPAPVAIAKEECACFLEALTVNSLPPQSWTAVDLMPPRLGSSEAEPEPDDRQRLVDDEVRRQQRLTGFQCEVARRSRTCMGRIGGIVAGKLAGCVDKHELH